VVKNGSKIRGRISSGDTRAGVGDLDQEHAVVPAVRTVRVPLPYMATAALSIRLVQTLFSSAVQAGTRGSDWSYC
jgi:hypothetical protein